MEKVDTLNIWVARDKGCNDLEYCIHVDGCLCLFFGTKPVRSGKWQEMSRVVNCAPYWRDNWCHTNKTIGSKKYYSEFWKVPNDHSCFAPNEIDDKFEYLTWEDEPVKLTIEDFPEIVHVCRKEMTREYFLNVWVPDIISQ